MHARLVIVAETEKEKVLRKEFTFNDAKVKKNILSLGSVLILPWDPWKHYFESSIYPYINYWLFRIDWHWYGDINVDFIRIKSTTIFTFVVLKSDSAPKQK